MTAPPRQPSSLRLAEPAPASRGMYRAATGLLLAMAAIYGLARFVGQGAAEGSSAWGYVRAFAEAAMIGGLADWFAVTALFRHPLGLPIPHTAIVPRNKDRIGDSLAAFLRDNFLISSVVARRMRRLDLAAAAGRFLTAPRDGGSSGRLRAGASRLIADVVGALDAERLGGMVRAMAAQRLRALDIAPILGQALESAIEGDRHIPLINAGIDWVGRTLVANEATVRAMISARAGSVLRWTGLDSTLSTKILDGLYKLIEDVAADEHHPLRQKAEEGLADLARRMREDPALQARVNRIKAEIIDNPAVGRWLDGLWGQARGAILKAARDPQAVMAGRLGEAMAQLGQLLLAGGRPARAINVFARRAAVGVAASYGDGIVRLVSDTVRGWDADTVTQRLEQAVGRDLQYIRINGTLVGGLVGLGLHMVDVLA